MNILVPHEVSTTGMKNPYLFLLLREIKKLNHDYNVQHGYGWLFEPGNWDLIHLHWPELLIKYQLPDMSRVDLIEEMHFRRVLDSIQSKKENGSKIVLTVHNETPHRDEVGIFDSFLDDIYAMVDGFIHMGSASKKIFLEVYPKLEKKKHFIIPHGDYSYFPSGMKRSECRKKLSIQDDEKLLLAFGAIRFKEELELGINAFKKSNINNSTLMIAGSIPNPYRSELAHYSTRKKIYTNLFNRRIKVHEKVISPGEVQIYLKAADLLIIPRFNTLNSGNVALGFTFGKVVIGPDYGVVGEILKKTGNPVFDPCNLKTVSKSIKSGFELADAGHGVKNKEYANHHMNWKDIARQTHLAYQSL